MSGRRACSGLRQVIISGPQARPSASAWGHGTQSLVGLLGYDERAHVDSGQPGTNKSCRARLVGHVVKSPLYYFIVHSRGRQIQHCHQVTWGRPQSTLAVGS